MSSIKRLFDVVSLPVKGARVGMGLMSLLALALTACNTDNLAPSDSDKRPAIVAGSTGYLPGQLAADFTLPAVGGGSFTLSENLATGALPAEAVVLYFTMWCPTCDEHMSHMASTVIPQFAGRDVRWVVVDYVSGSVSQTQTMAAANGYLGGAFTLTSDASQAVLRQFSAAMGTTIVIDPTGKILLNEDYRNGANLAAVLHALLP